MALARPLESHQLFLLIDPVALLYNFEMVWTEGGCGNAPQGDLLSTSQGYHYRDTCRM